MNNPYDLSAKSMSVDEHQGPERLIDYCIIRSIFITLGLFKIL